MAPPTTSPLSDDAALRRELRAALGDAYALGHELERGGMGRLFRAVERRTGRPVAVKVLPRDGDAGAETRFRREVAVTGALRHPGLLAVVARGETASLLYYATPYVAGGSLRDRLARDGRLPVGDVVRLLCQLADALAHAHACGVVHGDVKPENVLLDDDGRALLVDFGAVRLGGRAGDAAAPVVGTPLYMSPEQAAGEPALDARSDVYSLAVLGFELLAGRPPFGGASPRAVLLAHLGEPVPSLRAIRPEVPAALARTIERGLAKDPAARFATVGAFRRAVAASVRLAIPVAAARRGIALPGARRAATSWRALAAGVLLPVVSTAGAAALSAAMFGGALQAGAAGATLARAELPALPAADAPRSRWTSDVAAPAQREPRVQRLGVVVVRGDAAARPAPAPHPTVRFRTPLPFEVERRAHEHAAAAARHAASELETARLAHATAVAERSSRLAAAALAGVRERLGGVELEPLRLLDGLAAAEQVARVGAPDVRIEIDPDARRAAERRIVVRARAKRAVEPTCVQQRTAREAAKGRAT